MSGWAGGLRDAALLAVGVPVFVAVLAGAGAVILGPGALAAWAAWDALADTPGWLRAAGAVAGGAAATCLWGSVLASGDAK